MMGNPTPCQKCNDTGVNHPKGFLFHREKDDGFGYFICRRCGFELLDPKSIAKSRRIKGLFDGGWFGNTWISICSTHDESRRGRS